jgi:archaellum component FlaF (FlaF/FlaG flagellin family)
MSAPNQQLGGDGSIALGDDIPITLAVYKAGAAYPVTLTDAIATFKRNATDDDSTAVITKRLGAGITASGSTVTVTVAGADQASLSQTTVLFWGVRIKESSGAETEIASGTILLTRQPVRNPL